MSFGNNPNFDQSKDILPSQNAKIEVIGVGGGGSNAVNRMIDSDLEGVSFRVLNTDAQALLQSSADRRVQLGQNLTRGLGAGGNPSIGQKAAEESKDELQQTLEGSDLEGCLLIDQSLDCFRSSSLNKIKYKCWMHYELTKLICRIFLKKVLKY